MTPTLTHGYLQHLESVRRYYSILIEQDNFKHHNEYLNNKYNDLGIEIDLLKQYLVENVR